MKSNVTAVLPSHPDGRRLDAGCDLEQGARVAVVLSILRRLMADVPPSPAKPDRIIRTAFGALDTSAIMAH
jgi:hypothetical protein